jgi:hypothetical protein
LEESGLFHSPEKEPPYPLDRMLGGPQSLSGRYGEIEILDPTETGTPTSQSSSPQAVAILTTLPRLTHITYIHKHTRERKSSELAVCIVLRVSFLIT